MSSTGRDEAAHLALFRMDLKKVNENARRFEADSILLNTDGGGSGGDSRSTSGMSL